MAEARSEEDEENLRETREQVALRRNNNSSGGGGGGGGRANRRKPEHRLSQGPLSSIRAAIKRTSNRSTSLSESTPRERERERDRRRPEITILSAEPLSSWFPGAGFPPPPPPSAQIWGPTLAPPSPDIQPPPSYEEVIREKNQEQVVIVSASTAARPPPLLLPPSLPSALSVSTTTIATQTDAGATQHDPPHVHRPSRPPRPALPFPASKPPKPDQAPPPPPADSAFSSASSTQTPPPPPAYSASTTQTPPPPLPDSASSSLAAATQTPPPEPLPSSLTDQSDALQPRPRPRPRSKANLQPIRDEVRVQTLVKLREDGLRTLAARAQANGQELNQEVSGGRYLQELLEAFSADEWGFPEQRSPSQSESEDEDNQEAYDNHEEEEDEDMATLRARIQAFERETELKQRPEPKPRPSKPPTVAPKPKNAPSLVSVSAAKDCKGLWEDGGQSVVEPDRAQKPAIASKPVLRKPVQPDLPPRPSVAPRTTPPRSAQERGSSEGPVTPTLPPRPTLEPRARATKTEAENEEEGTTKHVNARPGVSSRPAAVTRRSSAPNLVSNVGPSPDSSPVPCRPSGPPRPSPSPAPALRKSTSVQSSPDPALPPRPASVKLLPLRPPPIKSQPGRPPPSPQSLPGDASANRTLAHATPTNQRASKKGPPLPPRPKPGHPLYTSSSSEKQEVLIVLDDPSPAPSELSSQSDNSSDLVPPSVQTLLDLDLNLGPAQDQDQDQTKPALDEPGQTQNILEMESVDLKKKQELDSTTGPRCLALFDFEAALDDELAFSRGDVISLLELIGGDGDWGRGRLRGRTGLFPLKFTQTLEPLPAAPSAGDTGKTAGDTAGDMGDTAEKQEPKLSLEKQEVLPSAEWAESQPEEWAESQPEKWAESQSEKWAESEEWAVALFDFPGQTADDLSFQKGALIQVLEHVDQDWRRGRAGLQEGLYPAAFTCAARPITAQRPGVRAKALFDFAAENEDELSLKVGDEVTQLETVDEQWIVGVVGGKRGIVPKNYISLVT